MDGGQRSRLKTELRLIGCAEAVFRGGREGGVESYPPHPHPTPPPLPPHKAGRREWLHYSRECNSRNQSAGESSRAIFIISEDDCLARGRAGLHSYAAAGLFTAPTHKKITIPFVCLFESRMKTHFPSPSNEQRVSHVSTRPTGGAAPSIPSPSPAVRWDKKKKTPNIIFWLPVMQGKCVKVCQGWNQMMYQM